MEPSGCGLVPVDLESRPLRIASVFIIFVASTAGVLLPILLAQHSRNKASQNLAFQICKHVGTGVIISTAWLHLLAPAAEKLSDPCLETRLGTYPWAFAVGLWTVMAMFFIEALAERYFYQVQRSTGSANHDSALESMPRAESYENDSQGSRQPSSNPGRLARKEMTVLDAYSSQPNNCHDSGCMESRAEVAGQLLVISILEFGAVFHSFIVGLTLGTTNNLVTLLVVLVFHQLFEGLGLGARLSVAPWPRNRKHLRYVFAGVFALATPAGVATGFGVQLQNADVQTLVSGMFSAISAGILMYTGLVELLARELLLSSEMRKASPKTLALAFVSLLFGMVAMGVLAKWA